MPGKANGNGCDNQLRSLKQVILYAPRMRRQRLKEVANASRREPGCSLSEVPELVLSSFSIVNHFVAISLQNGHRDYDHDHDHGLDLYKVDFFPRAFSILVF